MPVSSTLSGPEPRQPPALSLFFRFAHPFPSARTQVSADPDLLKAAVTDPANQDTWLQLCELVRATTVSAPTAAVEVKKEPTRVVKKELSPSAALPAPWRDTTTTTTTTTSSLAPPPPLRIPKLNQRVRVNWEGLGQLLDGTVVKIFEVGHGGKEEDSDARMRALQSGLSFDVLFDAEQIGEVPHLEIVSLLAASDDALEEAKVASKVRKSPTEIIMHSNSDRSCPTAEEEEGPRFRERDGGEEEEAGGRARAERVGAVEAARGAVARRACSGGGGGAASARTRGVRARIAAEADRAAVEDHDGEQQAAGEEEQVHSAAVRADKLMMSSPANTFVRAGTATAPPSSPPCTTSSRSRSC